MYKLHYNSLQQERAQPPPEDTYSLRSTRVTNDQSMLSPCWLMKVPISVTPVRIAYALTLLMVRPQDTLRLMLGLARGPSYRQ